MSIFATKTSFVNLESNATFGAEGSLNTYDNLAYSGLWKVSSLVDECIDWFSFGERLGTDFNALIRIRNIYPNFRVDDSRVKAMVTVIHNFLHDATTYHDKLVKKIILGDIIYRINCTEAYIELTRNVLIQRPCKLLERCSFSTALAS